MTVEQEALRLPLMAALAGRYPTPASSRLALKSSQAGIGPFQPLIRVRATAQMDPLWSPRLAQQPACFRDL